MYYSSMRLEVLRICMKRSADLVLLYLATPLETCLERNALRPPDVRVPEDIIRRMAARLEPPGEWWEAAAVAVGPSWDGHAERLWELVLGAIPRAREVAEEWERRGRAREEEEAAKAKDREANTRSAMHALDLALRKAVSSTVAEARNRAPARTAEAGKELSALAKVALEAARPEAGSITPDGTEKWIRGRVAAFESDARAMLDSLLG
ncbi:hypothetical protein DFJ74DRAFT_167489 [Hyaloraphidium curvatum]|nr:hypothetical protein DFJ74DRAFT_167489 [Hyaloraphidium curvatum]